MRRAGSDLPGRGAWPLIGAWSLSCLCIFFFSSRRRHTIFDCDWSSDVCSSDLAIAHTLLAVGAVRVGLTDGLTPRRAGAVGTSLGSVVIVLRRCVIRVEAGQLPLDRESVV